MQLPSWLLPVTDTYYWSMFSIVGAVVGCGCVTLPLHRA